MQYNRYSVKMSESKGGRGNEEARCANVVLLPTGHWSLKVSWKLDLDPRLYFTSCIHKMQKPAIKDNNSLLI